MSVTSTYGANIAFIEELYEKYRSNPDAVSATWREFFRDYEPQFAEDLDLEEQEQQQVAAAASGGAHAPAPLPAAPPPPPAAPTPAPAPRPVAVPSDQKVVPLR